jgi:hypothetical protein
MKHESQSAFRREPREVSSGNLFTRSLTARAIASMHRCAVADVAAEMWPNDRALMQFVTRASVSPAMTSVAGWAKELAQQYVSDAITALGPASAAAQILKQCLVLSFDGYGQISAPGFVSGLRRRRDTDQRACAGRWQRPLHPRRVAGACCDVEWAPHRQ